DPILAHRQIEGDALPILAPALDLPAGTDDARLACPLVICNVAVMVGTERLRHEHAHVVADHLGGAITEEPFRAWVEGAHRAPSVDADHGIHQAAHDGADFL